MTARTYPYGYRTAAPGWPAAMLTLEQLNTKPAWNRLHPEVRRRHVAIFDAAQDAGTLLGIGGGWRSAAQQEATFRSRYEPGYNPDAKSRVYWEGHGWWSIKSNNLAPSTPPGRSWHEEAPEVDDGDPLVAWAYAVDTVGDWHFLADHCAEFGLVEFDDVNDEPWHTQPVELPTARIKYSGETLKVWPLPGTDPQPEPPPDPKPPVKRKRERMNVYDIDKGTKTYVRIVLTGGRFKWARGAFNNTVGRLLSTGDATLDEMTIEEFRDGVRNFHSEGPSPWSPTEENAVPRAGLSTDQLKRVEAFDFEWTSANRE